MSSIYNDLRNSGQAFLYVFISPKANLNADIMDKRAQQLAKLSEMYAKDATYTPDEMIQIIRDGIVTKYGKQPELILQIIFDNAINIINHSVSGIGDGPVLDSGVLTFDAESNQYYDGSGNAFILDSAGKVVSKNGQYDDLKIESPVNLDTINVAPVTSTTAPKSTFWKDVQSVIDWIVGLLAKIGIVNNKSKVTAYTPNSTDWSKLNTSSTLQSSIGSYLPYIAGAAIVYYLVTETGGKDKKKKLKLL